MTYLTKPSDVYPSKTAVENVLGSTYRVKDFRPARVGELYLAIWSALVPTVLREWDKSERAYGPRFILEKIHTSYLNSIWE